MCLARTLLQADLLCELRFKLLQVLRVNLSSVQDESFHFFRYGPLDLHLFVITHIARHRKLPEEVTNKYLFHVGLLAEARLCLCVELIMGMIASWLTLAQAQSLNCVHFLVSNF